MQWSWHCDRLICICTALFLPIFMLFSSAFPLQSYTAFTFCGCYCTVITDTIGKQGFGRFWPLQRGVHGWLSHTFMLFESISASSEPWDYTEMSFNLFESTAEARLHRLCTRLVTKQNSNDTLCPLLYLPSGRLYCLPPPPHIFQILLIIVVCGKHWMWQELFYCSSLCSARGGGQSFRLLHHRLPFFRGDCWRGASVYIWYWCTCT